MLSNGIICPCSATQPSFASDFHLQILPPNTASRFHFTVLYEDLQVEKERDNSEIGLNLQSEFDNPSPDLNWC